MRTWLSCGQGISTPLSVLALLNKNARAPTLPAASKTAQPHHASKNERFGSNSRTHLAATLPLPSVVSFLSVSLSSVCCTVSTLLSAKWLSSEAGSYASANVLVVLSAQLVTLSPPYYINPVRKPYSLCAKLPTHIPVSNQAHAKRYALTARVLSLVDFCRSPLPLVKHPMSTLSALCPANRPCLVCFARLTSVSSCL